MSASAIAWEAFGKEARHQIVFEAWLSQEGPLTKQTPAQSAAEQPEGFMSAPARVLQGENNRSVAWILTWHDFSCVDDPGMQQCVERLKAVPFDSHECYDILENQMAKLPVVEKAKTEFFEW